MYDRATSRGSHNVISSQESAYGAMPCERQDGMTAAPSGQAPALANPSAWQVRNLGLMTSGTCGRTSSGSSSSATLQSSSESRLTQRLRMGGGI